METFLQKKSFIKFSSVFYSILMADNTFGLGSDQRPLPVGGADKNLDSDMKRKTFDVSKKCSVDIKIFYVLSKNLFEKETREALWRRN